MLRIVGQGQRVAQEMGLLGTQIAPQEILLEQFKKMKNLEFDVRVDFQAASPTERAAVFNQMLQGMAAGFPIPPQILLEASDWPYKEEIKAALEKQNNQLNPPNEALGKVLGAGQGQTASPNGVNISQ